MPFLEHDLMGLNMARHRFSENQILFLFREITLQLKSLHAIGLVHRDLKTSNILLGKDGIPSLIDFGHTLSFSDANIHLRSGTLAYLSPERLLSAKTGQILNETISGDIWALGCILAELLLGHPLFFRQKTPIKLMTVWEHLFGNHPLANALRKTHTSVNNCTQAREFKKFPLRSIFLNKCPRVSKSTLDLLEKLLNPCPKRRPSCDEILGLLDNQDRNPNVLIEIRKKLGEIQENCHEHEVRQKLLAERKLKLIKLTKKKIIPARNNPLKQKLREQEFKDIKLVKKANAPKSQNASSLKRVKTCQYRELNTPIN